MKNKKRLAADVLKVGVSRVWFDKNRLEEIKKALTREDIKKLINDLAIQAKPAKGNARGRIRKRIVQKRKGRQKGPGSRKGKRTARLSRKQEWINKIRSIRKYIMWLMENKKITKETYREIYKKSGGGMFRNKRHVKLYLQERGLLKNV